MAREGEDVQLVVVNAVARSLLMERRANSSDLDRCMVILSNGRQINYKTMVRGAAVEIRIDHLHHMMHQHRHRCDDLVAVCFALV